ncbi:MAG TPA: hypothetical protein PK490_11590 [Prosthecobacter sp.]|nr:hypothetical protein [Prosthecobacter sp.]HRK14928.1 hypothetical protein [Prosthecobacter sp.]
MNAELFQRLETEGGWLDFSRRAKWRLSGADRVRYLNGQVTQDARRADARSALHACVTNAKGRIEGDIFFHAAPDGESLLLDAPAGLRETLGMRLERYIIADDALLEDVTEEWQLWHRFGPSVDANGTTGGLICKRLACPGMDVWLPADAPPPGEALSEEDAGTLRILRGVPAWPHELNADVFPQEAGLEAETMSYTKGCYIGQEVLSRIKSTGRMPRELVLWTSEDEVAGGALLWREDGTKAGVVTSAARHPLSGLMQGLAYARQGAVEKDSRLLVGNDMASIAASLSIQTLPCR